MSLEAHRDPPPVALRDMQQFIMQNLRRSLLVAEIAHSGSCSVATAERLFLRHTGRSVQRWVRQARMTEAASVLRSSSRTISQVAASVGYEDPLYFSRVFRKVFGISPRQYAHHERRM